MNLSFMLDYAAGNPGAVNFLYVIDGIRDDELRYKIKHVIESNSIKGTDLYVLWNDLANQSLHKLGKIVDLVPPMVLTEATKRQDRSGLKIIEPYLSNPDRKKWEGNWRSIPNKVHTFQLGKEPFLVHIIKTGFEDKYLVVNEDAFELTLGKTKVMTKDEIFQVLGIEL